MTQPPPITPKTFSKTAKILIALLVVVCVALGSTIVVLLSTTKPDTSGVQILGITPYSAMVEEHSPPLMPTGYRFYIYMILQIKNPTQYNVTLRLFGEVNVTLTSMFPGDGLSGNHVLNNTIDFSVTKYSQGFYKMPIYAVDGWYGDSNAINGTINSYYISELWRAIGNPPSIV